MPSSRVKVKVCGMTQADQVRAAVDLGVDAIGMILHASSPRQINLQQAQAIRAVVPAFVSLVGVFVNCPADQLDALANAIGLDLVQLHGDESAEFANGLSTPYIKAIRAKTKQQIESEISLHHGAGAILLDPYVKGQHGGTGQKLDASLWPTSDQRLILAGGLSADNVASSVAALKPYAVDLNSGIEASAGNKDINLLEKALVSLGR